MPGKQVIRLLAVYIVSFVAGTILFVVLFHTPVFRSMDVLFYRGIGLLCVAAAVTGCILIALKISWKDIYIILLTIVAVNMLFFTHVPVTFERSISVFLLGYMDTKDVVTKEELTDVFLERYFTQGHAIDKRIHEQLVSGDIVRNGAGYSLTGRGKLLMGMYTTVIGLFGIRNPVIVPR